MESKFPASLMLIMFLFFGSIAFLVWQAWSTPFWTVMSLIPLMFAVVFEFITHFEYNPFNINPNFLSADGAISTLVKRPEYIGGRKYKATVSTKRRYVPETLHQKYLTGWIGFSTLLSGNVNIDIEGFKHDFVDVPRSDAVPEGAIVYLRKLNGKYPDYDINKDLTEQLDWQNHIISKIATISEKAKGISAQEAGEHSRGLMDVATMLTTVVNELKSKDVTREIRTGGERL